MAHTPLVVTAPHATPYDATYPTRSTENYAHALHEILQDMEDVSWDISDENITTTDIENFTYYWNGMMNHVFDYAAQAIDEHRDEVTITIAEPEYDDMSIPHAYIKFNPWYLKFCDVWIDCMKMKWKIFYMWKTESDPLLLKEKLTELLIAWPLTDTEITLNEEGGQSMRIVPAWKNVDL